MNLKIETTVEDIDALHDALNSSRPSSEEIKVPREAFRKLLYDHAVFTQYTEKYPIRTKGKDDE